MFLPIPLDSCPSFAVLNQPLSRHSGQDSSVQLLVGAWRAVLGSSRLFNWRHSVLQRKRSEQLQRSLLAEQFYVVIIIESAPAVRCRPTCRETAGCLTHVVSFKPQWPSRVGSVNQFLCVGLGRLRGCHLVRITRAKPGAAGLPGIPGVPPPEPTLRPPPGTSGTCAQMTPPWCGGPQPPSWGSLPRSWSWTTSRARSSPCSPT